MLQAKDLQGLTLAFRMVTIGDETVNVRISEALECDCCCSCRVTLSSDILLLQTSQYCSRVQYSGFTYPRATLHACKHVVHHNVADVVDSVEHVVQLANLQSTTGAFEWRMQRVSLSA